jgi:putative ABC transport system permease protein
MNFILRMAVRETRASWRRLLFFFICIAIGVAAIVALRSVIQNVRGVFGSEAKTLIAADVLVATTRDWTPEVRAAIDRRLTQAGATATTETIETPTMVRAARGGQTTRMVELRAVGPPFPFYGEVQLEQGVYSHELLKNRGALVGPELLTSLGIRVGDELAIGEATFTIRGVSRSEPGRRLGGFSLGPRVLLDVADMPATGLMTFGSRVRRVLLVQVPEARIEGLVAALAGDLRNDFVSVRSYRSSDDELGRDFDRAENYLSLVGLVVVVLGGIGVSSVTRVFVMQKIRSIAVLKCLGAVSGQIIAVYLLQVMVLGLAGSALGVAVARAAVASIPLVLDAGVTILADVEYGVTWSAALQGIAIGVLVSLLFSIVPLMHVRRVKPSLLLRDEAASGGHDWARTIAVGLVAVALVAVTAWQAASLRVGAIVFGGFVGLALVLHFAGQALVKAVEPLSRSRSFPLRHAVLHLSRPGSQTRVILLAVGLGSFFIVGVRSLQSSLLEEFSVEVAATAPDMFLMDIQRDQVDGLAALLNDPARGAGSFTPIPVLRARVVGVAGRETRLEDFEDVRARGSLAREYTVTYRDRLESNERVVAGRFWSGPAPDPEVSIEQGLNERFRIGVGDRVRFDIMGRSVEARVSSIREVDWRDSRNGGFMFVFRPGTLEQAPHTYIAPLKGPDDGDARVRLQRDLVEAFPNVSVVDFREVLRIVRDVLEKVTLAVSVVGGLVLASGVLILVGAVAMTKFQRVYEAAVFKTLGATTGAIRRMLLLEYGVLGLLAGTVGSLGAIALTWGVSRYALDIPWRVFAGEHMGAIVATAVLVAAIGVLSSLDVLRHRPLATLRAE